MTDRIGLTGLLERRAHRARAMRTRDDGEAWRWRRVDGWSPTWWPQGIAVGTHEGVPLALVSWFAQERRGRRQGARISVVDLRDRRRPRYRHVLLAVAEGDGFGPALVHAGGIVWSGDRLLVAATYGGIREFRLGDIRRMPDGTVLLPQHAEFLPGIRGERMRYSFLSLEAADDHAVDIIAGEYAAHDRGRLARVRVADGAARVRETFVPGIPQMQGAAAHEGTWYVSASRGDRHRGDLWSGTPDRMTRHPGALPIGPEDLAVWPERRQLWSVTEYPRRRRLVALPLDGIGRGPSAAAAGAAAAR